MIWYGRTKAHKRQDQCMSEDHGPDALHAKREPRYDPSGSVRVIRLTDDGLFANRCELTDVIYAIRNPPKPVLVVWYAHGWKHNAEPRDDDLKAFKDLVTELNEQQPLKQRRHVVGVYIGWDGGVGPRGPLQNASFYNRKQAADRISQSAVLTKVVAMAKYARKQRGTPEDMAIMIGHSFGARILHSATCQVLIDQVERRHPGEQKSAYDVISGPADLILLLNPAFEASMFTAIDSIRREGKAWERFAPSQQPLLLAITTENDWATRWAFPLARVLSFARKDYQRRTVGNHEHYVTHNLKRVGSREGRLPGSPFWFDDFEYGELRLQRAAGSDEQEYGDPFVVARTTSDVIDGHNGIWGDDLKRWMIGFLRKVQMERAHTPRPAAGVS